MTLRPYQQEAHDAIIKWVKKCTSPCLIEAATGAGKSHIIAAVADTIHKISGGKHILCLAPSRELVIQNREKFALTGNPSSVFSASVGEKSLRHPVVFGTPMTVKNKIRRFGSEFAAVVVDECHGITPTIKTIIEAITERNPNLRVIGLSATPYRLGTGYIYAIDEHGNPVGEDEADDPYFAACVYKIQAQQLIDEGFLTQPVIGEIGTGHYQTLHMQVNAQGKFDAADIDRAYRGAGRLTADIIQDVVAQSYDRKGVIIFAATIDHARECMASLPHGISQIITGETPKEERAKIIDDFKAQKLKYLVNVAVLTTGFDAPHVDVVALLRPTESVGLMQQIIGRGLRVAPNKQDVLILDYAENIDRHCPERDLFSPTISAAKTKIGDAIECECPSCRATNIFAAAKNPQKLKIDHNGYFIDLDGMPLMSEWGPIPAHHGRRCGGLVKIKGKMERCEYRWTFKECKECKTENDIAARKCVSCKAELVDPNKKLRLDAALQEQPIYTEQVIGWTVTPTLSRKGDPMMRINVETVAHKFSFWIFQQPKWPKARIETDMYRALQGKQPDTITYSKDAKSGYWKVLKYNANTSGNYDLRGSDVSRRMPHGVGGASNVFQFPAKAAS